MELLRSESINFPAYPASRKSRVFEFLVRWTYLVIIAI